MHCERTEYLPMETRCTQSGVIGYIELSRLPIPFSVRIMLNEKEIIPHSFDDLGNLCFSLEQLTMYLVEDFRYKEKTGSKENLKVQVKYRDSSFDAPRLYFDTLQGIYRRLSDLKELNLVIRKRRLFLKLNPDIELNEFVVLGQFLLDKKGEVVEIRQSGQDKLIVNKYVEPFEDFLNNNRDRFVLCRGLYEEPKRVIPKPNLVCPCCGKIITIYDLHDGYCVSVNDKTYHETCYSYYKKCDELLEHVIAISSERNDKK